LDRNRSAWPHLPELALSDACLNKTIFPSLRHARAMLASWCTDCNQVWPYSLLGRRSGRDLPTAMLARIIATVRPLRHWDAVSLDASCARRRKHFMLAQASINVPSTEKCSDESNGAACGLVSRVARKRRASGTAFSRCWPCHFSLAVSSPRPPRPRWRSAGRRRSTPHPVLGVPIAPERSGGWRRGDFLVSRGMGEPGSRGACPVGWRAQGKKVAPAPLRLRRSRCQPSFGQIKPLRGRVAAGEQHPQENTWSTLVLLHKRPGIAGGELETVA
jgi:hypothetical protein